MIQLIISTDSFETRWKGPCPMLRGPGNLSISRSSGLGFCSYNPKLPLHIR